LKSQRYNPSHLYAVNAEEIHLSSQAVLELMKAVLSRGVPFRFRALGWSMIPFVRNGDLITVTPIKKARPRVGDVVAFITRMNGRLIVHRIVAKDDDNFTILGDSVGIEETMMVPIGNILGRVQQITRNGHPTWLGIGPERVIIAWLSRKGSLIPLFRWLASCKRKILGRTNQP
jgi:signal peptidase I